MECWKSGTDIICTHSGAHLYSSPPRLFLMCMGSACCHSLLMGWAIEALTPNARPQGAKPHVNGPVLGAAGHYFSQHTIKPVLKKD